MHDGGQFVLNGFQMAGQSKRSGCPSICPVRKLYLCLASWGWLTASLLLIPYWSGTTCLHLVSQILFIYREVPWKELGKKFTGGSAKPFCSAMKGPVHSDLPVHVALGEVLARHSFLFTLQVQSSATGLLCCRRNVWVEKVEKANKSHVCTRPQLRWAPG